MQQLKVAEIKRLLNTPHLVVMCASPLADIAPDFSNLLFKSTYFFLSGLELKGAINVSWFDKQFFISIENKIKAYIRLVRNAFELVI